VEKISYSQELYSYQHHNPQGYTYIVHRIRHWFVRIK